MKKSFLLYMISMITLFFFSCNKVSVIEGVSTETIKGKEVAINKSYALSPSNNNFFTIQVGEVSVRLEVQNTATRGLAATAAYTNTDSVRYTRIFTTSGNVDITFKNNCIAKYKFGDGILSPAFTATNPLVLMFSKKSSPFNNPYTSINTSFFFQNTIQPLYTSGDDAYIAFRTTATPNIPSPIYYFGWIHVIVYQNQITFDKAAYRLGSFLDAGKLDD